jgi:purine-cytosine permease-like protein
LPSSPLSQNPPITIESPTAADQFAKSAGVRAGIAAEIPFVVLPFFVGPVAAAMGDVDIAFVVGLLVSGVVYVLLTRSLDVSHELELIESHPELADPVS